MTLRNGELIRFSWSSSESEVVLGLENLVQLVQFSTAHTFGSAVPKRRASSSRPSSTSDFSSADSEPGDDVLWLREMRVWPGELVVLLG